MAQDINIKRTSKGYGSDIYEVTGDIQNYTDAQLINRCDCGNFGGWVERRDSHGVAVVTVYID